jgi:site-specific DNA-methyltransferase (adenine-specific)
MSSIPLASILPNPNNPRSISEEKFQSLKNSIESFPKMMKLRPIIIDSNNIVLGGNMRLKALQALGYKEIPAEWVRKADELTDEEKRQFIIKDNVGFGEWDYDLLANEWDQGELEEWGLDLWDANENVRLEAEDDEYEIPDDIPVDVNHGDIIEIGPHRLICGDSIDMDTYSKLTDGKSYQLVVTDPPYNVDYTGGTKEKLKIQNDKMNDSEFYQFLLDFYIAAFAFSDHGCPIYVFHADSEGHNFRKAMMEGGWKLSQCIQWVKNSMVMGRQDYHWQHEPILYGWKEGAAHKWYADRKQTTILNFDRPSANREHPTMKPIPLVGYLLNNSSKVGDIVCDPFSGSGSTMVAAHQTDRICYGIELDPKYCQVIIDRMFKLDPSLEFKINGEHYQPVVKEENG